MGLARQFMSLDGTEIHRKTTETPLLVCPKKLEKMRLNIKIAQSFQKSRFKRGRDA